MNFDGYDQVGYQILAESGCYKKERYWLRGWHYNLNIKGHIEYIHGLTGKETVVTVESIRPIATFEVVECSTKNTTSETSLPMQPSNLLIRFQQLFTSMFSKTETTPQ